MKGVDLEEYYMTAMGKPLKDKPLGYLNGSSGAVTVYATYRGHGGVRGRVDYDGTTAEEKNSNVLNSVLD